MLVFAGVGMRVVGVGTHLWTHVLAFMLFLCAHICVCARICVRNCVCARVCVCKSVSAYIRVRACMWVSAWVFLAVNSHLLSLGAALLPLLSNTAAVHLACAAMRWDAKVGACVCKHLCAHSKERSIKGRGRMHTDYLCAQGERTIKGKGRMHTYYLFSSEGLASVCRQASKRDPLEPDPLESAIVVGGGGGRGGSSDCTCMAGAEQGTSLEFSSRISSKYSQV